MRPRGRGAGRASGRRTSGAAEAGERLRGARSAPAGRGGGRKAALCGAAQGWAGTGRLRGAGVGVWDERATGRLPCECQVVTRVYCLGGLLLGQQNMGLSALLCKFGIVRYFRFTEVRNRKYLGKFGT